MINKLLQIKNIANFEPVTEETSSNRTEKEIFAKTVRKNFKSRR